MGIYLYIATAIGLFIVTHSDGEWNIVKHTLKDHSLTSIAVTGDVILAGSRDGVWRSTYKGRTWNESNRNPAIPYALQAQLMVYHEMVESKNPSMADERGNLRRKV